MFPNGKLWDDITILRPHIWNAANIVNRKHAACATDSKGLWVMFIMKGGTCQVLYSYSPSAAASACASATHVQRSVC